MDFYFISIFPTIFTSFFETSLIAKAQEKKILTFTCINPRDFCIDKHKQVDDKIYGGGSGLLLKAEPIIKSVEYAVGLIRKKTNVEEKKFLIVFLTPSITIFNQKIAYERAKSYKHIIFVCGRYEGVDYRFVQRTQKTYPDNFVCVSIGQFVLLGGEVAAMAMTESVARLIPGVIKETTSRQEESYSLAYGMKNIEEPHYTRPQEVRGMKVPNILLGGNHKDIQKWKNDLKIQIQN